ncbi:MAG: AAA family ATPase [Clostridia bacterium]|nr:AAA family ATPase [Clostridia bacterium]
MKILRITAEGLALFKEKVVIDFFAEQRVLNDNSDMLTRLFGNIYSNNVLSIVGINASGKTTLLKLLSFIFDILNGGSLNRKHNKEILMGSKEVIIETFFWDENLGVCKLLSQISILKGKKYEEVYAFSDEKMWIKSTSKAKTKKDLFEFSDKPTKIRDNSSEYLQMDTSIAIAISKNEPLQVYNWLNYTNINFLSLVGDYPPELIAFLDPSIEAISFDNATAEIVVKFFGRDPIRVPNPLALESILSSGTVKGINVFLSAFMAFEQGGYILVDELENHFNREIVATLIRFFTSPKVNKHGATLVFSTHYAELLDEFERSDNIFIVRNKEGITVQKLNEILRRNDIKKSEAFKSDYLDGTVPSYDAYIDLKEGLMRGLITLGEG